MGGITMSIALQLKQARENSGYFQNEVATILHISRQSISKWENERAYPDLDNLIDLSNVYKVSLDDLIREKQELKEKLGLTDTQIDEQRKKLSNVNTKLYQNTDEGLILLIVSLISTMIPPVGIFVPMYVLWRNNKYNSLYKTIMLVSIIAIIVSLTNSFVIFSDLFLNLGTNTVYPTK
ncbi:helix-turn-helix domain-containing protein [Pediococcus ethanolidurans]|nr:helix-turn-helix domain-containing protein [Pediococcus ethanolidurans]